MSRRPRAVYDGVCNLCVGAVRFLTAIDRNHEIEYAPYQSLGSAEKRAYGLSVAELQGRIHVVQADGSILKGAAALGEVCKHLSPVVSICGLFNTRLAQGLYDIIASRRYRLFGCRERCYVAAASSGPEDQVNLVGVGYE